MIESPDPKPRSRPPGRLRQFFSRIGVYGDLSSRFMTWGTARCPAWLEPLFLLGYTAIFFAVCGRARRAAAANIRAVRPATGALGSRIGAWRVFWNFAATCAEAERARAEGDCVDWEFVGLEHFDELAAMEGGALVLTAHMGNYDVAAPLFARKLRRKLHAVRAPERLARTQEFRDDTRRTETSEAFEIRYNTPDGFLGIELLHVLRAGEVVAIQGDRTGFGVAAIESQMLGLALSVPRGPFALSMTVGAPIFPIFVIRLGRRRYRIRVEAPISCRRTGTDRDADLRAAADAWAETLGSVVRKHWAQWYVFEPLFDSARDSSGRPDA